MTRSTYVAGNIRTSRLEREAGNVKTFLENSADDIVRPAEWGTDRDDPRLLWNEARAFVTRIDEPAAGEYVFVRPEGHDDGDLTVRVVLPERDAVGAGMYNYETTAATLLKRMAADGGWLEVRPFEITDGSINCPECGSFVSVGRDDAGIPWADCTELGCGGVLDVDDLRDRDAVSNVR